MKANRGIWFYFLVVVPVPCFAHNIFASGWGLKFANSPEGILVAAMCELVGVVVFFKGCIEIWAKSMNPGGGHSYYTALKWLIAGVVFYYAPIFVNLGYNSIFLN
jgi:hypothetical protein